MISVWSLFVAVFISQFPTCFAESIHVKPFNINRVCPSCSKSRQPVPVIFANLRYMQIKNNFTYSSPIYWLFQLCCVNHNLHQFFDDEILTKCWFRSSTWWNTWYILVFITSNPWRKAIISGGFLMLRKAPFSARRSRTNLAMFGKTRLVSRSENCQWLDFPHLFQFTIGETIHGAVSIFLKYGKMFLFDSKPGFLMFPVVQFSSLTNQTIFRCPQRWHWEIPNDHYDHFSGG